MGIERKDARGLGDLFAASFVRVDTAAMAMVIAIGADPLTSIALVVLAEIVLAGVGLIAGMAAFARPEGRALLWLCMGVQVGVAFTGVFSFGFGALVIIVVVFTWTVGAARRIGVPVIDRRGIAGETVGLGLGLAPLLVVLS